MKESRMYEGIPFLDYVRFKREWGEKYAIVIRDFSNPESIEFKYRKQYLIKGRYVRPSFFSSGLRSPNYYVVDKEAELDGIWCVYLIKNPNK